MTGACKLTARPQQPLAQAHPHHGPWDSPLCSFIPNRVPLLPAQGIVTSLHSKPSSTLKLF